MRYKKCKSWRQLQDENDRRWEGYVASTDYRHTSQGRHIDRMRGIAAASKTADDAFRVVCRDLP